MPVEPGSCIEVCSGVVVDVSRATSRAADESDTVRSRSRDSGGAEARTDGVMHAVVVRFVVAVVVGGGVVVAIPGREHDTAQPALPIDFPIEFSILRQC